MNGPHQLRQALTSDSVASVTTLKHRIEQAIEFRGIKQNEVERRCGFAAGVLAQLKSRPRPPHEKLANVAAVLGVDLAWLKTGAGSPDYETPWTERVFVKGETVEAPAVASVETPVRERRVVYDDRYPNREVAIAIYEPKVPPPVIKAARSISFKGKEDLSYREWCEVIENLHREYKRVEAGQSVNDTELDPSFLDLDIQAK